jgi:SAM-dependent methyltransferase
MEKSKILKRATDKKSAVVRSNLNAQLGTKDFTGWLGDILRDLPTGNVLDLCCGGGNQLCLHAIAPGTRALTGVDLSQHALEVASGRIERLGFSGNLALVPMDIDDAFKSAPLKDQLFDLITCCYGLYYSKNTRRLIDSMRDHLTPDGAIVIVGPHNGNNSSLFNVLSAHMNIPEFVLYSSTEYMATEVVPALEDSPNFTLDKFVNSVAFPDIQTLVEYWQNSTFHSQKAEAKVIKNLKTHFETHDSFIVEKHIMACTIRNS